MIGLPEQASAHAAQIDFIIEIIHYAMALLFVGWGAFFLYCLWRFRAKNNPVADYHGVQSHLSTYIEGGVIVFEAILLIFLAFPFWANWVGGFPTKEENPVVVKVIAEQFAWNFHYPGPDGKFGTMDSSRVDAQLNPIGLDRKNDPGAADDIVTLNQLHLPLNKQALLFISSKDVIHSFKLVEMRVTQDAIPGLRVPISFTPTKVGKYDIACAQLCGIGHYSMKGSLTIESEDNFSKWLTEQAASQGGGDEFWG